MSDAGMRCPHVTGGCTQYCEAANRFARERDDARQALREYEHHVMVGRDEQHDRLVRERDDAMAERDALQKAVSRCLLSDPPGDCYAAESVDLRAERSALQKAVDARADELRQMPRESWLKGGRLGESRDERDDARRLVEMMRDDPGAIVPVPLPWEGE